METFAVLFDMDGLMLDTERMARKAWTRALAENGYQLDELSYLRLVGRTVVDAQGIFLDLFGPELPYLKLFDLCQTYYKEDIELNGIPVKPGLLELLDFLEQNEIRKAVASSTASWFVKHKLSRAGIAERFEAIVGGDQVLHGKPAPDIFLEAAKRLNITPECCVVLEDSEAGIRAGYAAGALPLMVPDLKQPEPEISGLAYRILPSLHEVIPMLAQFLQNGLPVLRR